MAKRNRKVPGINASSTADIAFMLLIFFLITTSMDTDRGLARRLPPPPENDQQKDDVIIKERNILQVRINKDDQLMVGGEWFDIKQLREKAKEFISNPNDDPNMPEKHAKHLPFFGDVMIPDKHVISVQNDVGTSIIIRRRFLKLNLKNMEENKQWENLIRAVSARCRN